MPPVYAKDPPKDPPKEKPRERYYIKSTDNGRWEKVSRNAFIRSDTHLAVFGDNDDEIKEQIAQHEDLTPDCFEHHDWRGCFVLRFRSASDLPEVLRRTELYGETISVGFTLDKRLIKKLTGKDSKRIRQGCYVIDKQWIKDYQSIYYNPERAEKYLKDIAWREEGHQKTHRIPTSKMRWDELFWLWRDMADTVDSYSAFKVTLSRRGYSTKYAMQIGQPTTRVDCVKSIPLLADLCIKLFGKPKYRKRRHFLKYIKKFYRTHMKDSYMEGEFKKFILQEIKVIKDHRKEKFRARTKLQEAWRKRNR
jgi:hypothetical protein